MAIKRELSPFFRIEIFPSMKCNLNCPTCDRGREGSELSDFGRIKYLYDNIRDDAIFGKSVFRITGGEPTIFPMINELIEYFSGINPLSRVDLITNGLELERISAANLKRINPIISVYPLTVERLRRSKAVRASLGRRITGLKPNILSHDDMSRPGTIRSGIPVKSVCLSAVLVGDTENVYPCCRAHRIEQDHKCNYHLKLSSGNLYSKLAGIIENTDLCAHCPRYYINKVAIKL